MVTPPSVATHPRVGLGLASTALWGGLTVCKLVRLTHTPELTYVRGRSPSPATHPQSLCGVGRHVCARWCWCPSMLTLLLPCRVTPWCRLQAPRQSWRGLRSEERGMCSVVRWRDNDGMEEHA